MENAWIIMQSQAKKKKKRFKVLWETQMNESWKEIL